MAAQDSFWPVKAKTGRPKSEAAKRIAALFRRRVTTYWSAKEIQQFKCLEGEGCFLDLSDLDVIERYYAAERKKPDEKAVHRRDLSTFLNNYGGERDRANLWAEKHPLPASNGAAPTKGQPARWGDFLDEVYPSASDAVRADFHRAPADVREEFRKWEEKF